MWPLTTRLENDYCNITVANQLITVIRFVAKNYTDLWKKFTNRLHLIHHACEILLGTKQRSCSGRGGVAGDLVPTEVMRYVLLARLDTSHEFVNVSFFFPLWKYVRHVSWGQCGIPVRRASVGWLMGAQFRTAASASHATCGGLYFIFSIFLLCVNTKGVAPVRAILLYESRNLMRWLGN